MIENCKYSRTLGNYPCTCPYVLYGNMCKEDCARVHMTNDFIALFEHGSYVYGTNNPMSDKDFICIVDDKYSDFLDKFENSIYEYNSERDQTVIHNINIPEVDFQYMTKSKFIEMVKENNIMALESIFLPQRNIVAGNVEQFAEYFDCNKWKIRQSISSTASNSWAKAHKKMTVEKDFDMYRGQKSLFHSLRILMFGNQLCEYGKIIHFDCANDYWNDIYYKMKDATWEDYKSKYKPVYNELRSKLAELAPKEK